MENIGKKLGQAALVGMSVILSACATSGTRSESDVRVKEYVALKESVIETHEKSLVGPDKPWLFSGNEDDAYFRGFEENYCKMDQKTGKAIPHLQCERRFIMSVNALLARTYYAADPSAVQNSCRNAPLICGDLQASEVLFRNLHNAGIAESKREKLSQLEEWKQQKLTDRELQDALHMQFKFEKGQLVTNM